VTRRSRAFALALAANKLLGASNAVAPNVETVVMQVRGPRILAAPLVGAARRQGAPPEVITPQNLREVYGVEVRVAVVDGARVCLPAL
jgi:ABC-type cobalamin/Fe3+-siderophores transport system ATPase subunit